MTVPDEAVPVEQLSFTEASRELDAIVNFFEQREVDVDVLVGRLERATALIDELDRRLRRTQAQVEELVPRLDALAGDVAGPDAGGTTMSDGAEPTADADDRLYFRQLLSGRDFAQGDMMARQMVNFVYLIGDRETGEAVAVDPAYAVQDLLDILDADGMRLTGVLGTHFHPDHLGGQMGRVVARGDQHPAREGAGADPRPGRRGALGGAHDRCRRRRPRRPPQRRRRAGRPGRRWR